MTVPRRKQWLTARKGSFPSVRGLAGAILQSMTIPHYPADELVAGGVLPAPVLIPLTLLAIFCLRLLRSPDSRPRGRETLVRLQAAAAALVGTLPDMDSAANSTGGEGPDPGLPPRKLLLRRWRAAQLICGFALLACWAAAQRYGALADWPVGALIVIAFSALLAGWIALTLSPVHWIGYRGPWGGPFARQRLLRFRRSLRTPATPRPRTPGRQPTVASMVTYTPTPRHFVQMGSLQPRVLEACSECIRARRNILVTGVRDAGKTTLLQALAGLIPADEPVLVLDGWDELDLGGARLERIVLRGIDSPGSRRQAIERALREVPGRLVVSNVLPLEEAEILRAMGRARQGSLLAIAATSAEMALRQLAAWNLVDGFPWVAACREIAARIHLVVLVGSGCGGLGRAVEVVRVEQVRDGWKLRPVSEL